MLDVKRHRCCFREEEKNKQKKQKVAAACTVTLRFSYLRLFWLQTMNIIGIYNFFLGGGCKMSGKSKLGISGLDCAMVQAARRVLFSLL